MSHTTMLRCLLQIERRRGDGTSHGKIWLVSSSSTVPMAVTLLVGRFACINGLLPLQYPFVTGSWVLL